MSVLERHREDQHVEVGAVAERSPLAGVREPAGFGEAAGASVRLGDGEHEAAASAAAAQATTASTSARRIVYRCARRARPRTPRPSPSRRRLPSDPDPPARPRFRPAIAPRPSLATRVRTARIPAVGRAERVGAVEGRPQPDLAERDPFVLDERFDADRARGDGRPPASRGPRRARDRSGRRRPARRWPLPPRAPRGARPPNRPLARAP